MSQIQKLCEIAFFIYLFFDVCLHSYSAFSCHPFSPPHLYFLQKTWNLVFARVLENMEFSVCTECWNTWYSQYLNHISICLLKHNRLSQKRKENTTNKKKMVPNWINYLLFIIIIYWNRIQIFHNTFFQYISNCCMPGIYGFITYKHNGFIFAMITIIHSIW